MADVHPIRKDLLSYLTIFEKLLRKLLTSSCEKCVDKQNINLQPGQSYLSAVLDNHPSILHNRPNIVYRNRADMNNKITCNVGNERRLIQPGTNRVLLSPDLRKFDVTLLTALLKNIPENACFLSRTQCVGICDDCDVKKAVVTVTYFRNSVMHDRDDVYEDLTRNNIPIPNLESCKSWDELKDHVEENFKLLLAYVRDVRNYPMTGNILFDLI